MYVIDTSVLVTAKRSYYAMDVAPSFWQALERLHHDGMIVCVDTVYREILSFGDPVDVLTKWMSALLPQGGTADKADSNVSMAWGKLAGWIQRQSRFNASVLTHFSEAKNADGWVTAYALHNDMTVVSLENRKPTSNTRVMIPDLCDAHQIKHLDTFDFLREVGVTL